tara:strand:- start:103 stop:489 length:387 start_codon:yes stop_codon:yes gene_type:complete
MGTKLSPEQQFGLILAAIAALLAFWPLLSKTQPSWYFASVALVLLLISWKFSKRLSPATKGWLFLGKKLGAFNSVLLLCLAFYLLITPLALIFKIIRRDPLQLRHKNLDSYWIKTDKSWTPESFKQQF